jgi:uncharacterized repeat protein (TIGR02543 family)
MKMKSSWSLLVVILASVLFSLLMISCPIEIDGPRLGSLSLSTDGTLARTIQPGEGEITVASYKVTGVGPSEETFTPVTSSTTPISVDGLIQGIWSITVEGLDSEDATIATKTLDVTIVSGQNTEATFILNWLTGLGDLDVTVTWPTSVTSFASIHGVLSQSGTEIQTFDLLAADAFSSEGVKSITKNIVGLATGSYDFVLTFIDALGTRIGIPYMEQVNIYDGMTSTGTCVIPEILLPIETPVFSPAGGRIDIGQGVSITSASNGVAIHYTTDGSTPTAGSTLYTGAILLTKNSTIKAIALDPTRFASAVASADFEVPAAEPSFSPEGDTYDSSRTVSLSCTTEGAVIHYTVDGTDPTEASATYSSALAVNENTVVKAIATHPDFGNSEISSAGYFIKAGAPQFSLDDSVSYKIRPQELFLTSATEGAAFIYTLDGTDPKVSGTAYDAGTGISLTVSTTVKAFSRKSNMVDSDVVTKSYTLPPVAETPVMSPIAGTYATAQDITLTTGTAGAQIRYTIDGTDPTTSSTLYTESFTISVNTTVKAIAIKDGYWDSPVAESSYLIRAVAPAFSPAAGTYSGSQTVSLTSATAGATIRYTTDGSDPTGSSTIYTTPITIGHTKTVKAYSIKAGMADSTIVSALYEILGSSGITIENPTHYSVAIQLPAGWAGATVASNAGGTASAMVTPSPADGEVSYVWYLDGVVAKNNSNQVASTGPTIRFGIGSEEVTLGSGPHLLSLKVSKGSMTFSDQKLISASLVGTVYTVTYDPQNGSTPSPTTMTVTNGFPYGTLATTSRDGFDFAGWWTGANGTGSVVTEETQVDIGANQTLYATWTPATYTVTFDSQEGETSVPTTKDVIHASTYGALATVSREGYSFDGWWTEPEGAGSQITADSTVGIVADQILYAKWIANSYIVTFNSQGGINLNPANKSVTYDDTYGALATTVKLGHTLGGWWTGENGTGVQVTTDSIVAVSSNHTLFAKWVPNTQTITFDAQGGTGPDPATKVVTYGQEYGVLASTTREGQVFDGWWTGTDGSGSQVTASTVFTGAIDRTLYAKWIFEVFTGPAGGLVFYENPNYETDGWRYLEAAPYGWYDGTQDSHGAYIGDDDPYFQWGVFGYTVEPTATATSVGTGTTNTTNIVYYHDTLYTLYSEKGDYYTNPHEYYIFNDGTVAAKVCAEHSVESEGTVYDDWFLPSKDELNLMYTSLKSQSLGGLNGNSYWSSSEFNWGSAYRQMFDTGTQYDIVRNFDNQVRPVRAY